MGRETVGKAESLKREKEELGKRERARKEEFAKLKRERDERVEREREHAEQAQKLEKEREAWMEEEKKREEEFQRVKKERDEVEKREMQHQVQLVNLPLIQTTACPPVPLSPGLYLNHVPHQTMYHDAMN
jgi:hypothetical protein